MCRDLLIKNLDLFYAFESSWKVLFTRVHTYATSVWKYIQCEWCGQEVVIVPLDLQILVKKRHWHEQPAGWNVLL